MSAIKLTPEQCFWLVDHPEWEVGKLDRDGTPPAEWGTLSEWGTYYAYSTPWNGNVATKDQSGEVYVFLPKGAK